MAKSASRPDATSIRFRCTQCASVLKVSIRMANRYIDCPKCKNRTQVPGNQQQADEDATDYGVNKLTYDLTGKCRNCGEKMKKGAVICVHCGYDFREGKILDVVDKTKVTAELPTWGQIVSSLFTKSVQQGWTQTLSAFGLTQVFLPMLAGGLVWLITWLIKDPQALDSPTWPAYIGIGIFVFGQLLFIGMWHDAMYGVASRALWDRDVSPGVMVSTVYGLLNYAIAFTLPFLLLVLVAGTITWPEHKQDYLNDDLFAQVPWPEVTLNPIGTAIDLFLLPFTLVYFYFGVGTYAADLTPNPLKVFQWIGSCFVDAIVFLLLTIAIYIAAFALPAILVVVGIMVGDVGMQMCLIMAGIIAVAAAPFALVAPAQIIGLVIKRGMYG